MVRNEKQSHRLHEPGVSLGICLGASTVSIVQLKSGADYPKPHIVSTAIHAHEGDPKKTLRQALENYDLTSITGIAATGRKFRNMVHLSSIAEPEAVELAYAYVRSPDTSSPAIVSAGGETFMVYVLDASGRINNVFTGNKCASGTGEFFLQQLRRMNVTLEEAARWSATAEPYNVSGRCSVFCKSDCTHATNKGIPKSKVTAGLCRMMAGKILELLNKVEKHHIMLTGGTTANRMMVSYLQQKIENLIIPEQAACFEALGAALWALDHETAPFPGTSDLFVQASGPFETLAPLNHFMDMVTFKTMPTDRIRSGDTCTLGLDVGSTTTKGVLLRNSDKAMLASVYLRTNGDPVKAARKCYAKILDQINLHVNAAQIKITGLGVCGSGRQIAALHAMTDGMLNEIIAHATAAVYFDAKVDTIFEIGGQDAKYTYITSGVPSDYAMNEACSAGTGSFLEEAAYESLGLNTEKIADIALQGQRPPNFNDQCAAFIASDIKNAIHEGIAHEDIVAGLIYSICMNYANRVKGNRPVGRKVFMQGGVCYNHAVPLAMAAIVGIKIVVPPEPGLMGAFGAALEIIKRIEAGLLPKSRFDLQTLAERDVGFGRSFVCKGGKKRCDRKCEIATVLMDGHKYPFGGACNRYYNLRHNVRYETEQLDLVRIRQQMIFDTFGPQPEDRSARHPGKRIGISKGFLVNTYYPLYANFFNALGFEVVLPDQPAPEGILHRNAPFCFPAELAHGFFYSLLEMENPPEWIFLPHFQSIPAQNGNASGQVCPFVQGEPFILKTTFADRLNRRGIQILSPMLNLARGLPKAETALIEVARQLGVRDKEARRAFRLALERQEQCQQQMRRHGRIVLEQLSADPDQIAVVLFGRPYNAFASEAHMGIPHKLASRGVRVIPLDFLPLNDEPTKHHMYWGMGQMILKAAHQVKAHPQLFGTYITNFSCGPDSFVIGYFRDIMGKKPSLTLELDSHTADAGLETRIEAFLDIVTAYRRLEAGRPIQVSQSSFRPARTVIENKAVTVFSSSGEKFDLTDPRVTLLFPSMGRIGTDCLAAVFQGKGLNARAFPPAGEAELKTGRANTTCKECLPLILTTGTLLNYVRQHKKRGEILVYFMAGGEGPCRFGQYSIFMQDLIKRLQIPDVALLTLSSENAYGGLDNDFQRRGWWSLVISDTLEDIRSMLLANAADPALAMNIFEEELGRVIKSLGQGDFKKVEHQLERSAARLQKIALQKPVAEVPTIYLAGEIFVRRDGLSRQYLTENLAKRGFATICAPVIEWMHYADYLADSNLSEYRLSLMEKFQMMLRRKFKRKYEIRIKKRLARSNLVHATPIDVAKIIENAAPFVSPQLKGEAILTVGSALTEIVTSACGVIAIGPFGCMPNRLAEAILAEAMTPATKLSIDRQAARQKSVLTQIDDLPFLAIESDGSPFPQLIDAKLDTFCLRARRLHTKIRSGTEPNRLR